MSNRKFRTGGNKVARQSTKDAQTHGLSTKTSVAKLIRALLATSPLSLPADEAAAIATVEKHITPSERGRLTKLHKKAAKAHSGQLGQHTPAYLAATTTLFTAVKEIVVTCEVREVETHIKEDQKEHEDHLLDEIRTLVVSDYSTNMQVFRRDLQIHESMSDEEMYVEIRDRLITHLTEQELIRIYSMQHEVRMLTAMHSDELSEILGEPADKDTADTRTIELKKDDVSAGVDRLLDLSTQSFIVLDRLIELAHARMTGELFKFGTDYGAGRSASTLLARSINSANKIWSRKEVPDGEQSGSGSNQEARSDEGDRPSA